MIGHLAVHAAEACMPKTVQVPQICHDTRRECPFFCPEICVQWIGKQSVIDFGNDVVCEYFCRLSGL